MATGIESYFANMPTSFGGAQLTASDPASLFSSGNYQSLLGAQWMDLGGNLSQSGQGAHMLLGQYGQSRGSGFSGASSGSQPSGGGFSSDFSTDIDLGLPGQQRFVIKDGKAAIEFYGEDGQLLDSMETAEFVQTLMDAASGDDAAIERLRGVGAGDWVDSFAKVHEQYSDGGQFAPSQSAYTGSSADYGSYGQHSSSGYQGLSAEDIQRQLPEGKSVLRFNEDTQQWEVITKEGVQSFDKAEAEEARAAHKAAGGGAEVDPTRFGGETAIVTQEGTVTVLRDPLAGQGTPTSPYGMRHHPISGQYKMHTGTDLGAPTGTPVYAASDGFIERVGNDGDGYGNKIVLQHAESSAVDTTYNHLNGFAPGIESGTYVEKGELIGYVGSTGNSTGPHLHYEVRVNGTAIDPLKDYGGVS